MVEVEQQAASLLSALSCFIGCLLELSRENGPWPDPGKTAPQRRGESMNEPHDPSRTVDVPSAPADSRNPSSAYPFGQIADEFVEAFRQGKRPSVEEFAQRYPAYAYDIRDMLPALALMEQA